jgi:hypothetical protein
MQVEIPKEGPTAGLEDSEGNHTLDWLASFHPHADLRKFCVPTLTMDQGGSARNFERIIQEQRTHPGAFDTSPEPPWIPFSL